MDVSREHPLPGQGLLYPLMVIAAIAVIVFSIAGIAAIAGWMPSSMLSGTASATAKPEPVTPKPDAVAPAPRKGAAFQCAECGLIQSVREIEQQSTLTAASLSDYVHPSAALPAVGF